jgi:transcription initiation factor TFIID subunit 10
MIMATNPPPENTEQVAAAPNGTQAEPDAVVAPVPPEPKLPTHKDTSLKELLGKMDDYAPIVGHARARCLSGASATASLNAPNM